MDGAREPVLAALENIDGCLLKYYGCQMSLIGGPSFPAQRDDIARLLTNAIGIAAESEAFQRWKYWDSHPLFPNSRSYVLLEGEIMVAHGCCWPIRLQGSFGELSAMHLIDWAAKRNFPGAGMRVLRLCQQDVDAVFSIGGSEMTRRILPVFGFKSYNSIYFLYRPLRPISPALRNSPRDWKMPARIVRNLGRYIFPRVSLPLGWSVSRTEPHKIPEFLFPRPLADEAVSKRNAELLTYMMNCPVVQDANCYVLRQRNVAKAYFCLIIIRDQARLVDFGPTGLDEQTATALGLAAQNVARSDFKRVLDICVATTEQPVREGLVRSGFRMGTEERIKVFKVNSALQETARFRLTLLDWDAAVL